MNAFLGVEASATGRRWLGPTAEADRRAWVRPMAAKAERGAGAPWPKGPARSISSISAGVTAPGIMS
ncbi:hypothetical protein, partial [Albidovulum sp.]|uniref:hypothetical protein n=1 Tax=Albidovulum sp. TaxID=1872424 RepID=UPI0025BFAE68